jgi:hypothetical protein
VPRGQPGTWSGCTIDGCAGKAVGRGLCRKHYTRWWSHGDPSVVVVHERGVCTIEGCARPQKAHGWCQTHYRRWQRHGDPLVVERVRVAGTAEQRFWARVDLNGPLPERRPDLGPCWQWTGTLQVGGYGSFWPTPGEGRVAHRWGYERFVAPIPAGLELDHLCHNRACVRFDHLEPVTHAENNRRGDGYAGRNARKTQCPQGHAYDAANTLHRKDGTRRCRTCAEERALRGRARAGAAP